MDDRCASARYGGNEKWFLFSDTGAKPPESCIFTLLVNVSAFLGE